MGNTKAGGRKVSATIRAKYGDDFWQKAGAQGGLAKCKKKGFASDKVGADGLTGRQRAKKVGAIGGAISVRKPRYEI